MHGVLLTALYGVACILLFDWKATLSHALIFGLSLASVLVSQRSNSIVEALRRIREEKDGRLYFVLFFSAVAFGFGLYYGLGIARVVIETLLAFMFFLAFSTVGSYWGRDKAN